MAYIRSRTFKIPLSKYEEVWHWTDLQISRLKKALLSELSVRMVPEKVRCVRHSADWYRRFFKGAYGGKASDGSEIRTQQRRRCPELCRTVGLVFQNPFNQLSGAKETVFEEIAFGLAELRCSQQRK